MKAKAPLAYTQRKLLLSHWSPRIAKAVCHSVYPDFLGTYEQHLWLLTLKAAESATGPKPMGWTTYAWEAKEKGVMFLQPYPRIEDTRTCSPSHYLHYIMQCEQSKINALLAGAYRCSARLNAKYLAKAPRSMRSTPCPRLLLGALMRMRMRKSLAHPLLQTSSCAL